MPLCLACTSSFPGASLHTAPCGHCFCRACLERMASLALRDRSLVPLRCCRKELATETVALAFTALPPRDASQYYALLAERTRDWPRSDLVSDQEYASSVARVGARQCPGCGVGVLRASGCVHMTCPNGHAFCFACGRAWRTCQCAT